MSEIPAITERISSLRRTLTEAVEAKGLRHPEVLAISQKLDEVIFNYYDLTRKPDGGHILPRGSTAGSRSVK